MASQIAQKIINFQFSSKMGNIYTTHLSDISNFSTDGTP